MTTFRARHYQSGQPLLIQTQGELISAVEPLQLPITDAAALPWVGPGLFDIQVNGYHGLWFCSESLATDDVAIIVQALADRGIARCFPTLITSSFEAMRHGLETLYQAISLHDHVRRVVRGFHLEGPYIAADDGPRGAHPRQHVRPASFREFTRWQETADGLVRLVTIAPETDGVLQFIRDAVTAGVVVAIGHTAATPAQIVAAVDAGASMSTHLGNGCSAMMHRHNNVLWPQLADDRLTASIIADGWHLPHSILQCILRCKTPARMVLTCDVSGFGGCSPGRYESGDVRVDVLEDGRIVVAGQRQYLAGSAATTGDCVIHLMHSCQLPLAVAWELAAGRPAALFGEPECRLEVGQQATLTLFRWQASAYQPVATIVQGELVSGTIGVD